MKTSLAPVLFVICVLIVMPSFAQKKYNKLFDLIDKAHQEGNYALALRYNSEAINRVEKDIDSIENVASQQIDKDEYWETLMNLIHNKGILLLETGDYEEAVRCIEQGLDIHKEVFDIENPDYATFLDNLAVAKQNLGEYSEAEKLYIKSKEIRAKILGVKDPDYALSINHLGSFYHEIGDYENAKDYYIKSLNIIKNRDGKHNLQYANFQNNLAILYQEIGWYEQAEILILRSMGIIKRVKSEKHLEYGLALLNLASLYQATYQHTKALPLLEESLEIIDKKIGKNHLTYATALHQMGKAQQAIGQLPKAESLYIESLQIRQRIAGEKHPDYANSLLQLALFYQFTSQLDKAENWYILHLKACITQIQTYFPFFSEKQKEKFYANMSDNFEKFNSFAFQRKDEHPELLNEVFNYRLTTKAILFQSANKMRKQILNSGNPDLINTYKNWARLKDRLARIYSPVKVKKIKLFLEDVAKLEKETEQLEKLLSEQSVIFKQFNDKQVIRWKEVKDRLKEGEALVEVVRFRYFDIQKNKWADSINYAGMIVLPQPQAFPIVSILNNGKDLENKHLKSYLFAIKEKQTDTESYNHYWMPFKEKIGKADKIFFSPDGVYNQLNLNILQNSETGNYLIDETEIHLLTNAKEILEIGNTLPSNTKTAKITKAVLIGRPKYSIGTKDDLTDLEGTEKEIKNIAQILENGQWKTEVYVGEAASEAIVKQSENPTVLHIASHGFFSFKQDEDPMLGSGLMLTSYHNPNQIDTDDGRLTGYEAMNLCLDMTELVVLSACETGVGNVKIGEGVYGLQRAFKIAGAKNVIMSLWLADDWATQSLMKEFYHQWIVLGNRRQAFRVAQQKMKDKYDDPYYWGAFVMLGE